MGWNGNNGAETKPLARRQNEKKPATTSPSLVRGIVAGLIVVVAAALAIYLMTQQDAKPKEPAPNAPKVEKISDVAKSIPSAPQKDPVIEERTRKVAKIKAMTPEQRLDFLYEEAKKKPLDLTPSTNKVFKTGVEQVMSWIFTTRLGDPPPPLPQLTIFDEVHLAEIIIADNPILETDSERVKDAKETVALAKKELVNFIKEGGDVEEFLTYYRDQLREAHNEYVKAQRKIINAYRDGEDPEVCRVYAEQINAELEEKGIKKFEVPQALIDKFTNQK